MAVLIVQVVAVLGMGHRKAVCCCADQDAYMDQDKKRPQWIGPIRTAAEAAQAQQQAGCR
jgi:hypothetical protein